MNLAVKLYKDCADKPEGIPDQWPAEVVELGDKVDLPHGEGWALMKKDEFAAHVEQEKSKYEEWAASQEEPEPNHTVTFTADEYAQYLKFKEKA